MPQVNSVRTNPVQSQTVSSNPSQVTVNAGDSLGKIAQRLGVTTQALVQANLSKYPSLGSNPNAIKVGWQLNVPGAGQTQPTQPARPTQGTQATQGWGPTPVGDNSVRQTQQTGTVQRPNDFGNKLSAGGAQSIELRMKQHLDAIEKTGVGVYYGDHSPMKNMSAQERKDWAAQNAKPGTTPNANFKESSCIGWAFENVGAAYAAAGKTERWSEIMRIVTSKGSKGIDLAKELQKDGWQAVYWNPDAKNPNDGNAEHSFSAVQVKRGNGYYGLKVTDSIVDYRPTDAAKTKENNEGIEKLKKVPFFFGMAKGGMHTFVGRNGNVNEFHWNHMPDSKTAIEEKPLKDWGWNSGVIMVPPGTWPTE
jgi:LysM repeat protein